MTCHGSAKSHHAAGKTLTDIVTYRYNGELMYVPVASSYNQALTHAREAFPQLKRLRDTALSLSLISPGREQQFVGISASAWPKLIAHMSRYQVIDVQVTQAHDPAISIPNITITYADAEVDEAERPEPVPPYVESVTDEKTYSRPPSPSHSPSSMLHPKRSWFFHKLHGQCA